MERLQGIFLDFYGTLASGDRHAVESVCQAVIDDYDLQINAPKLAVQWGLSYFSAIEAVNGSRFRLLVDIERDTLIETLLPLTGKIEVDSYIDQLNGYLVQPTLFEEVGEVLANSSLPICLVSNADDRELLAALKHHRLQLDYVVTSERARCYKPKPRIFRYALEMTGWSAERVLHVGDSLHSDIGGAQRVGIKTAWVKRGQRISDIGTASPDFTWPDLRPIISLKKE